MADGTVPKNGFSAKFLASLRPEAERLEIADPGTKGLRLCACGYRLGEGRRLSGITATATDAT